MLRIEADHMTATAEQRRVQLADGTVVLLAPESAIDVAYGEGARRVRLLKGRAYFEVAADRRPFAVQAGEVEARDIGTAFDVGLDARGVDVAVREGIVDVSAARVPAATAERLQAGDWVRVTTTGRVERGRLPADQVASWMQGQLVVKNRPVGEVVDALRPYFDGLVVLRGAVARGSAADRRVQSLRSCRSAARRGAGARCQHASHIAVAHRDLGRLMVDVRKNLKMESAAVVS